MKLFSIASGSSGNCVYAGAGDTHLLIDAGISGKRIAEGLQTYGIRPDALDGLLVTHEHVDHVKGLGVLARRHRLPVYATEGTWVELEAAGSLGRLDPSQKVVIRRDEPFRIKDMEVTAFSIPHDAREPVGYTLQSGGKKIGLATDLGCCNPYILSHLKGSNLLYLEANHDPRMLQVGKYPYFLKLRIASDLGHLSNEASADMVRELCSESLSHIVLGHLSHENNLVELAYASVRMELDRWKANPVGLSVAERAANSPLITL
ncbi:MBL fold metallo-hydrolase [Anaerotalea alkaliphila]|uniref:MBL fold metallo-hydrolase n=1 Tax=Anaerotalea alkaliphila TaxID=2662126 RepID=A0A7X5KP67_9FIRM|nr:MBL fold metallo-hydrolase [Anaerotalea alkaliphila]NDL68628.1 MBL fold metallo-hydrolase [Anaerotalea alkaliphila]